MEAKQSRVLERLQAREDARKAQLVQRQEESLTTEASTESAAAFLQQFTAEARSLQRDIEIYRAAGNSTKQGANASTDIQLLNDRLGRLEESLSLASYYLLQYDVRQCLERTKILKELLYEAKEARQPRKKFSFSGKAISSIENASLAQEPPRNLSLQANVALQPKGRVISDLRATNVLVKGEELTEMDDVTINDLQECCIYILGPISALYVHQVQKCTIVTGPVVGACYIEDAQDSNFYMAARQARIHASFDCQFYLYTLSNPIIEDSSRLSIGPYSCDVYNEAAAHLEQCGFLEKKNQWMSIQDFGWLKSSPSPNWTIIPEEQRKNPPNDMPCTQFIHLTAREMTMVPM